MLKENTYYEGKIPEGYDLCISPSKGYIIVDVDRHDNKDGFKHISKQILKELEETFHYKTKNNGVHYWFKYTGDKELLNKTSGLGIDLRVGTKGYVVFYAPGDIRNYINKVNKTSLSINKWVENLFS